MSFERWDVLTALFPFVDSVRSKPLPVLVLSRQGFNGAHDHLVTAMVTTAAAGRWASDYPVVDLPIAGLRKPCVVRWKVFSLPKDAVARRIGTMGSLNRDALLIALDGAMGNPRSTTRAH